MNSKFPVSRPVEDRPGAKNREITPHHHRSCTSAVAPSCQFRQKNPERVAGGPSPGTRPGTVPAVFAALMIAVVWAIPQLAVSQTASGGETPVAGSKLLSPASYGFDIPVAEIEPCDWTTAETTVDGQPTVVRVHVKIGDHYVVMLPNGQLVARTADQIGPCDKPFQPARPNQIGQQLLQGELARFPGMKMVKTRHYVFLHNTSPEFAEVTKTILESMFGGVESFVKKQGLETEDPPVPLIVIMFRTAGEFQAYREMPNGVLAYYDMVSNRVVLHEESVFADTRPDLARGQLLSTIAHEGAHQILHNIGVQRRLSLWPVWLSEGLAEFFAPTSFGRRNRWKGAGVVNDLRMFELESYLQSQNITGFDGTSIERAVTAGRLDSTGYALAWAIVHYLANQKKDAFDELVRRMNRLEPMRGMAARPGDPVIENLQYFEELFGDQLADTETGMIDYLSRLKYSSPVADYIHYVGMAIIPVEGGEKRLACFFHTRENVEDWKQNLQNRFSAEQLRQAQWQVSEFANRAAANQAIRRFLRLADRLARDRGFEGRDIGHDRAS